MKNITLSAEQNAIDYARKQAEADNTTLNAKFRQWLAEYGRKQQALTFRKTIEDLQSKVDTGGRKFTRDEMNER
jgi:hypothetical protein